MNKIRITAILLTAITLVSVLAACGKKTSQDTTNGSLPDATQSVIAEDTNPTPETDWQEPSEPEDTDDSYCSDTLSYYGQQYLVKDRFSRLRSREASLGFLTTDNEIYSTNNVEHNLLEGIENIEKVITFADMIAYEDTNGVGTVDSLGRKYADVKGTLVYAFREMLSSDMILFSIDEDGYMYINSFNSSDVKIRDNEKLYIRDLTDDVYYDRVDKLDIGNITGNTRITYVYAEVDGRKLYYDFSGIYYFGNKAQIWLHSVNENADKVFDYGYDNILTSPIFSKSDDENKLYYTTGWDKDELSITLPDGYKVSDIEKVMFADMTVIIFKDGSVYSGWLTGSALVNVELSCIEELTQYNKDGKIQEFYLSTYACNANPTIVVLMDDNILYEYGSEAE